MKENYVKPYVEVIEIELEGILCQSGNGSFDLDDFFNEDFSTYPFN